MRIVSAHFSLPRPSCNRVRERHTGGYLTPPPARAYNCEEARNAGDNDYCDG
jgi:hypothetical protein